MILSIRFINEQYFHKTSVTDTTVMNKTSIHLAYSFYFQNSSSVFSLLISFFNKCFFWYFYFLCFKSCYGLYCALLYFIFVFLIFSSWKQPFFCVLKNNCVINFEKFKGMHSYWCPYRANLEAADKQLE